MQTWLAISWYQLSANVANCRSCQHVSIKNIEGGLQALQETVDNACNWLETTALVKWNFHVQVDVMMMRERNWETFIQLCDDDWSDAIYSGMLYTCLYLCIGGCVDDSTATATGRRSISQECRCVSVHIISHIAGDTIKVLHWPTCVLCAWSFLTTHNFFLCSV